MDNYEPGVYTEKVLEATKLLSNTGRNKLLFAVLVQNSSPQHSGRGHGVRPLPLASPACPFSPLLPVSTACACHLPHLSVLGYLAAVAAASAQPGQGRAAVAG